MPLQFDVNIVAPENPGQLIERRLRHPVRQRTLFTAGQAQQPVGKFRQIVGRRGGLQPRLRVLGPRAQLHARHQPTKVLIPRTSLHQQRVTALIPRRNLRAQMRLDLVFPGCFVESRGPVDAVHVRQRHRLRALRRRHGDVVLRHAGAAQKAEGRPGVQLNVRRRHSPLHDLRDHVAAHFRQALAPPLVQETQRILIEPHLVQNRRVHIAQMIRIFDGV